MYEVEKTFSYNDNFLQKIAVLGKLVSEKTFTDKYYDNKDFDLTSKSFWLRERAGKWELKIHGSNGGGVGMSREMEDETEISEMLDLPRIGLTRGLQEESYIPFCVITSHRKRFAVGDLRVDMDEVTSEDFNYKVGEVEMEVATEIEMPEVQ